MRFDTPFLSSVPVGAPAPMLGVAAAALGAGALVAAALLRADVDDITAAQ